MLNFGRLLFGLISSVFLSLPWTLLAAEERALVSLLSGSESQPYKQTMTGIAASVVDVSPYIKLEEYWTDGSAAQLQTAISALNAGEPAVVIVLGTAALRAFRSSDTDTPVVAALIADPSIIASYQNTTGVALEIPLARQLEVLRELLPSAQRYGILYSPESNQAKVDEASVLLAAEGLSFVATAVSKPSELPGSLENISRRVDLIWGLPDPVVMNSRTAKPILVEAFRKNIALIGPTPSWTRAGALSSLEWDYEDIGAQVAENVVEITNGSPVQSLPVSSPRTVDYSLNLRTAEQINVQLEDIHISNASRVYE